MPYALFAALVALAIGWGGGLVPAAVARAVWAGVALGYATQLFGTWLFSVRLLPDRRMLAHGVGMVWRMVVVGMTAVLLLRADTAIAASTLFALVTFFFVSTVMEPLFSRIEPLKRR